MSKTIRFFILLAAFLSIGTFSAKAEEELPDTLISSPPVIYLNPIISSTRPHAPAVRNVECTYENGYLYIDFINPEGICTITVSAPESGTCICEDFDSSVPAEIYIGHMEYACIEVRTSAGRTYIGYIDY